MKQRGFTLIEVMIVVAIIAILSAFAIPLYQSYVLRVHRVDARNMLEEASQKLQQNYTINHSYNKDSTQNAIGDDTLSSWGLSVSPISGTTRYNISFKSISTSTYELQAVPTGPQIKDDCGTFTLSSTNIRTAGGKTARESLSKECWSR